MRIDNPISDNAIITGSFTGSFKGDGSQLTGITAEWDGSHTGDASITGDLTVGNLITAGVVDGVDVSELKSSFDTDSAKLAGIQAGATNDTAELSSLDGRVSSVEGDVSSILAASSADKDSFAEIVSLINSVDTVNDTAFGGYVTSNNTAVAQNAAAISSEETARISDVAVINSKLDGIESGATGDQTAAEILTALKTVDGAGSGLDADLLDGHSSVYFATAASVATNTQAIADLDLTYASDADVTAVANDVAINAAAIAANTSKLSGIEAGATGDQSAAEILTALKTVDGAGSGLDADLLDGQSSAYYATAASVSTNTGAIATINAKDPVLTVIGDASGTATFTNLGNATMTLTIADDSHNHTIANVDGLQSALDAKATPSDVTSAVNNLINGAGTAYDTLKELGDAIIANDSDIATILTTQSGKLAKASNLSDLTSVSTARTNLGLGTAAITNSTAYASAAQGTFGETAYNWGNHATAGYLTSYTDTNTTYSAGSGLSLTGTTFSHTDTSTQGSVNNSGRTYIQDITLDGFGHVTGIASATETVVNTDTVNTYTAGNGLSLSGNTFLMSGAYTGNFSATGNITAYSDSRLKKDVKTIEGALDKTKELRGVEFTRIEDDTKSIGVIAQELEAVLPELVLTDDEGMKSVNYAQITGLLIEAVKELSAKVDELSK